MRRVLFAGGATGGHLYPALALAEELSRRGGVDPIFLTGDQPLVREILEPHRVRMLCIEGLPSGQPWRWGTIGRRVTQLLTRERIDAVVALGGRPGVLPGFWARWKRRPLFLLEQNRVLGRANSLLLPLADRIFLSFDDTAPEDRLRDRALRLGCPVRPGFAPSSLAGYGDPLLLVLGGSQGAQDLNKLAPAALARAKRGWKILHVSGPGKEQGIRNAYREAGLLASVRPFLQDPSVALADASLVLARAGGSTIAELTAVGRGSLLLPYPHHRDRQQFLNAEAVTAAGGAEIVTTDPDAVAFRLDALLADRSLRVAMAKSARSIGRPDAAARIADVIATHLDADPERKSDALGVDSTPQLERMGSHKNRLSGVSGRRGAEIAPSHGDRTGDGER